MFSGSGYFRLEALALALESWGLGASGVLGVSRRI